MLAATPDAGGVVGAEGAAVRLRDAALALLVAPLVVAGLLIEGALPDRLDPPTPQTFAGGPETPTASLTATATRFPTVTPTWPHPWVIATVTMVPETPPPTINRPVTATPTPGR